MDAPTRVVQDFDAWAASYETTPLQTLVFAPVRTTAIALALRHRPMPSRVLDVGCGTGRLLRELRTVAPRAVLVGVDPAAKMLLQAATLAHDSGLRLVRATAERLPFGRHAFDLVFATMSVRHWADSRAGAVEVLRVLRPGGVLVVADVPSGGPDRLPEPVSQLVASRAVSLLASSPAPVRGPVPEVEVIAMARATSLPER